MNLQDKKILSFEEGCKLLGYSKSSVYKFIAAGKLPYSKPNGKRIFFERTKLEAFLLGSSVNDESQKEETQQVLFDIALKAVKLSSLSQAETSKQLSNG